MRTWASVPGPIVRPWPQVHIVGTINAQHDPAEAEKDAATATAAPAASASAKPKAELQITVVVELHNVAVRSTDAEWRDADSDQAWRSVWRRLPHRSANHSIVSATFGSVRRQQTCGTAHANMHGRAEVRTLACCALRPALRVVVTVQSL